MLLLVRDIDRAHVVATTEGFGMHDLLPNTLLADRMQEHLTRVGAPDWTEVEQTFARECQANMYISPIPPDQTGPRGYRTPASPP